ncbi:MAG: transcriptional repressor [Chloroflexi bacterium]|nr:transcriptional repressor [Chloroflexota bacterium]MBU1746334.1 transcriptional repressor [Chloroflexota bacterium]
MNPPQNGNAEEPNVSRLLRRAELRVTPQRVLLLEIIRDSDGHLDADEIYRQARDHHPRISLSTVYRTLSLLKEMGLVRELDFDEDHRHYELCDSGECKHYHLYCLECGAVIEFESPLVNELTEQLAREYDFEIADCRVAVSGLCPRCREEHHD